MNYSDFPTDEDGNFWSSKIPRGGADWYINVRPNHSGGVEVTADFHTMDGDCNHFTSLEARRVSHDLRKAADLVEAMEQAHGEGNGR